MSGSLSGEDHQGHEISEGQAVLLLARSAVGAAPIKEMERLCAEVAALPGVRRVVFGFSEQGLPSLREALDELLGTSSERILIVPLLLPAEPHFNAWLTRTLQRWRSAADRPWPDISVATMAGNHPRMMSLLGDLVHSGGEPVAMPKPPKAQVEGSIVPPQKRRLLVCLGGPCNVAGANVIWGHLRNEQDRLALRTAGDGTHTAKASCLGPCALAPVLQVWPEGTYYGGVDEAGVDRIIQEHLLGGDVVEDLAYHPTGRKQALRR
jgi:(2Fe-2S) ferredoxin